MFATLGFLVINPSLPQDFLGPLDSSQLDPLHSLSLADQFPHNLLSSCMPKEALVSDLV